MKTVRRHNGQAFVGLRASLTRGDLDEQAQAIAEAYVQADRDRCGDRAGAAPVRRSVLVGRTILLSG